jgi:outer membrane lipoprotein-sorting protein
MSRRFAAGAALGTAVVLSLTGCLGESDSKSGSGSAGGAVQLSAAQVLQKASQNTSKVDTYKISFTMSGTEGGDSVKMRGSMRYQAKPPAFSMAFSDISSGGQTVPGGMQMIVVGNTLYMKMPFLTQVTGGKPWMKFSQSDLRRDKNLKEITQSGDQVNPQLLTKMFTTSKDVKSAGKEAVGGLQTTHYTGTFTNKDALTALSPRERKQAAEFLGNEGEKVAFDLWVDDQQLPRKLVMKSLPGAREKMAMTMLFGGYGEPMNIKAPSPDQVGKAPRQLLS